MGDLNCIQKGGKIKICALLYKTGVISLIYLRNCIKTRRETRERPRTRPAQRRNSRRWTQKSVRIVIVLGCMCDRLEITILVQQQRSDPRNKYGDIRNEYGDQRLPYLCLTHLCQRFAPHMQRFLCNVSSSFVCSTCQSVNLLI